MTHCHFDIINQKSLMKMGRIRYGTFANYCYPSSLRAYTASSLLIRQSSVTFIGLPVEWKGSVLRMSLNSVIVHRSSKWIYFEDYILPWYLSVPLAGMRMFLLWQDFLFFCWDIPCTKVHWNSHFQAFPGKSRLFCQCSFSCLY